MHPTELFRATLSRLLVVLNHHHVRFHLTGGITSVAYGEPRMTQDIDIVVDNASLAQSLQSFTAAVSQAGFVFDVAAVRRAVAVRSMWAFGCGCSGERLEHVAGVDQPDVIG